MNYQQAARILAKELEAEGYSCRIDDNHAHARFYVSSGGVERFVALSKTQNYDESNILHIKRRDIRQEIAWLPKPVKAELKRNGHDKPMIMHPEQVDHKVYSIKVTIQKGGVLSVYVPNQVIPVERPQALVNILAESNRLYLTFVKEGGKAFGGTRSEELSCYRFSKKDVPFEYADKLPKDFKGPTLCARMRNGALVCDTPLPDEIKPRTRKEVIASKPKISVEDGRELISMLNEWIEQAEKEGSEPEVQIKNNRISVSIIEKKRTEL